MWENAKLMTTKILSWCRWTIVYNFCPLFGTSYPTNMYVFDVLMRWISCCLYDGNMLGFLQHELQLLSIEAPCEKAKVFWWKSLATFLLDWRNTCVCVLFQGDRPSKNSKWSLSSGYPNNFKPILLKGSYRNYVAFRFTVIHMTFLPMTDPWDDCIFMY